MDKGYCGVIVFFYKNIIQNGNTDCIPELQLAFLSLITNRSSTAFEGNQVNRTKTQTQTELHVAQLHISTSECSHPWHFICQAKPTLTTNMKQRFGVLDTYRSLINIDYY